MRVGRGSQTRDRPRATRQRWPTRSRRSRSPGLPRTGAALSRPSANGSARAWKSRPRSDVPVAPQWRPVRESSYLQIVTANICETFARGNVCLVRPRSQRVSASLGRVATPIAPAGRGAPGAGLFPRMHGKRLPSCRVCRSHGSDLVARTFDSYPAKFWPLLTGQRR